MRTKHRQDLFRDGVPKEPGLPSPCKAARLHTRGETSTWEINKPVAAVTAGALRREFRENSDTHSTVNDRVTSLCSGSVHGKQRGFSRTAALRRLRSPTSRNNGIKGHVKVQPPHPRKMDQHFLSSKHLHLTSVPRSLEFFTQQIRSLFQ